MADVMNSLFGMTPESIQRQRDADLRAEALQYAQLDPFQRATMGIYQGAGRLGSAVGGLLGGQDPEKMRLQQRQEMMSGVDLTDPTSLKQGIQAAMQNKDYALVAELTGRYQATTKAGLEARKTESEIAKNMREKTAADPVQQLLRTGKYTIPSMAEYEKSGQISDLVPVDPNEPTALSETSEGIFLVNKKDGTKIARIGSAPERGSKTSVNVTNAQESAFAKERGQLQAKTLAEVETQAKASANAVNRLTNMEKLNKSDLITGPLAGSAIGAGQFLSSLGLLSPDSAKTLASSEIYDKQAKDLVMQDLGGKLGAQISNSDRDFIEARIPQLRNSQPARTELIKKLKEIHSKNIDYYQRMSKEATAKGNLNAFDFASGAPSNTESTQSNVATKRFNPATGKLEVIGGQ